MRALPTLALLALAATQNGLAQQTETMAYQSDIKRLLDVVTRHLYHNREAFLRVGFKDTQWKRLIVKELTSNSGDAIEKTRLLSLTDRSFLGTAPALNITIRAYPDENKLVISDSGVGMAKDELAKNLGTIARSGTSEFLAKVETEGKPSSEGNTGSSTNLIGQFGLGFYSSFLVADRVEVASKSNSDPTQWVFESDADAGEFTIKQDPRGNTLGRGTEITLHLKADAKEYLDSDNLKKLIAKHSTFSTTAPIYLWEDTTSTETIEDDESSAEQAADGTTEPKEPKTRQVTTSGWKQLNDQPPIWMRDPKTVSDADYISFYEAHFKETTPPLFWTHIKGDVGSTAFRALVYVPPTIANDVFSMNYVDLNAVRLYVRRVFITNDLGPTFLPKWLQYVKIIIDADDLPLNVGRDSLQANKALTQIQRNVIKKTIDMMDNYATSSDEAKVEKYKEFYKIGGTPLKLGAHDDSKLRPRLMKLLRYSSSLETSTSLDQYVERRRKGQKQIFFAAMAGGAAEDLAKSPFVEKIVARGYEVLWFLEPLDEMLVGAIGTWEGMKFQDVAKKGLQFGDEDEKEKEEDEKFKETYKPLIEYLKKELSSGVNEVLISTRLTTSPCAVITDQYAWTGNMERLMAAQSNAREQESVMSNFFKNAKKVLEINPRHPLIEGLLEKLDVDGEDNEDLRDTVWTLWDTSMVRSGFALKDTDSYFTRVERLLRRSVGVSENAKAALGDIRSAPPVEEGPVQPSEPETPDPLAGLRGMPGMDTGDFADWSEIKKKMAAENEGEAAGHDEL